MDGAWYDLLRDDHRPEVIEVLLVAESPPDPAPGERRFFYAPVLDAKDNLYRGVVTAVYGTEPDFDLADKAANLRRLKRDGFWLVDLCDAPVNHLGARRAGKPSRPQSLDSSSGPARQPRAAGR